MSYGELARMIDSSPRAVGGACGGNPIPILLPCHRVVAAKGLGGYGGGHQQPMVKAWLLGHEMKKAGA
jgi:methylated-DNA-[protein]-cysteine S-methyltransferase